MCGCGEQTRIAPFTSARDGMVHGEHLRFVHGHNTPKGIVWQRLTGDKAGRWYIYDRNRKHVAWARIVAQNTIGRPLLRSENAHHVNGDKSDDRPENLQVLTAAEHSRLHGFLTKRRESPLPV